MKITSFFHLTPFGLLRMLVLLGAAMPALAADPAGGVARLSHVEGSVVLSPAGDTEWIDAMPRRELAKGDRVWADRGSRAEIHVRSNALRMDGQTQIGFTALDGRATQLSVVRGAVQARLRDLLEGENFELDTPNLAFRALQPGEYRLDVDPTRGITSVRVHSGSAKVYGESGQALTLLEGQQFSFEGRGLSQTAAQPVPAPPDSFGRWAAQRDGLRPGSTATARQQAVPLQEERVPAQQVQHVQQVQQVPRVQQVQQVQQMPRVQQAQQGQQAQQAQQARQAQQVQQARQAQAQQARRAQQAQAQQAQAQQQTLRLRQAQLQQAQREAEQGRVAERMRREAQARQIAKQGQRDAQTRMAAERYQRETLGRHLEQGRRMQQAQSEAREQERQRVLVEQWRREDQEAQRIARQQWANQNRSEAQPRVAIAEERIRETQVRQQSAAMGAPPMQQQGIVILREVAPVVRR